MNNKWYNADKTKMLDLNSVVGYNYYNAEKYIKENIFPEETNSFKIYGDRLIIYLNGYEISYRGKEAKEIFDTLIACYREKKEILNG